MGGQVLNLMEQADYEPAVKIDSRGGDGVLTSLDQCDTKIDVIIDFSFHTAISSLLDYAVKNSVPTVLCTTGYTSEELELIDNAAKTIPIFRSANMSLGANALADLVRRAVSLFPNADVEIVETHHNLKVDAPSGTALMLAEAIESARDGESELVFGRHETNKRREKKEIGIHSLRGGNKAGEHSVYFLGTDEEIVITHRASSKRVFAEGALAAAIWLLKQKAGFYTMEDVIRM
jgi:4-hydroxy-tetrahydrodipicolinate reductase